CNDGWTIWACDPGVGACGPIREATAQAGHCWNPTYGYFLLWSPAGRNRRNRRRTELFRRARLWPDHRAFHPYFATILIIAKLTFISPILYSSMTVGTSSDKNPIVDLTS